MADRYDVVVVGAGLAGLVATAELTAAGRRVLLLDQENRRSLGGQAFWSFGGLFLVDSPEQRRLRVRDSADLALADWLGSARFDESDAMGRAWAEAFVDFAAGPMRAWLHGLGVRWFPLVQWAERGGYPPGGHGNSVPRFHIVWGTGPGLLEPFVRSLLDARAAGLVDVRFRHRVTEVVTTGGRVTGVRGEVLAHDEVGTLARGVVSTADYGILPPLLREFGQRYPRVRLQLLEATSDVQVEALMDGRIDAGLFIPPVPARYANELSYLPIVREPLMLALPAGPDGNADATASGAAVSLADYADEPLVIFPRRVAPAFHDIIMGCYAALGLTPRVGQEAIQMQTIVSLVSAGMGVALVPASLCNLRRTGVSYLPLRDAGPDIETGLVWREAGAGSVSPVLRSFIEIAGALASAMTMTQNAGIKPDAAAG